MKFLAFLLLIPTLAGASAVQVSNPPTNGNAITPSSVNSSSINTTYGVVAGSVTVGGTVLTANVVAGNVGIGTTSPNAKLHVSSSGPVILDGAGVKLNIGNVNGGGYSAFNVAGNMDLNGGNIYLNQGGSTAYQLNQNALYLSPGSQVTTAGGGTLFLQYGASAGNVTSNLQSGSFGIGTNTPATLLDVNGSAQFGSGAAKSTATVTGDYLLAGQAELALGAFTTAQVQAKTPNRAGTLIYNSTLSLVCVSTGTTVQGYARLVAGGTCQ